MPRYDAKRIEAKWQAFWDARQTFRVEMDTSKPKLYVLDMFPYPSGDGLHVGHPEGYTATDIVCRYSRMCGKNVLHPMGWDAFGLPAEQHAIKTGTHPRITTEKNIGTFKRQLKSLGFSFDWSREIATTDPDYVRWTQWIFLQLFDTWYDPDYPWTGPDGVARVGKGRPIAELPIPTEVRAAGETAVRKYQDEHRLAYIHYAPVNWCPQLGTVLANEEVIDGRSEVGGFPVERRPLRQWMLRITAYAERLIDELEPLQWSESIKALQRNWIGKSIGAEVDFLVAPEAEGSHPLGALHGGALHECTDGTQPVGFFDAWKAQRQSSGFPATPEPNVIRVYTTRPDTLFGVTYMVLAPEHPLVDQITTPEQKAAVDAYRQKAALKSDLDRTDLAKEKTGVFTGGYAINPVNGERVPVWIADYVLISYGTGAIMAVPAHDERDFEFAVTFNIPYRYVVDPIEGNDKWLKEHYKPLNAIHMSIEDILDEKQELIESQLSVVTERILADTDIQAYYCEECVRLEAKLHQGLDPDYDELNTLRMCFREYPECFNGAFQQDGVLINSASNMTDISINGLSTSDACNRIVRDIETLGFGRKAVNYRLRDWLFSRQRYWGEPFPIWHELDANGVPTGMVRAVSTDQLPVALPEMEDFQPTGTPEPLLSKAPEEWLYATAPDGTKLKRETNSMPQWAGSCWYYLRFCDNKNSEQFIDPAKEKYWLPVDLYIGGAEHAVLHLLYSRFWHKVLFDRGHVTTPEPFARLVNQGMILGEPEFFTYIQSLGEMGFESVSYEDVETRSVDGKSAYYRKSLNVPLEEMGISPADVELINGKPYLKGHSGILLGMRSSKMSKSRGNVINPDHVVEQYGADSLRLYEMFMGPLEATKPWSMAGVDGIYRFLGRVWRLMVDDKSDDVVLSSAVQEIPATPAQLRTLHKTIKAVTEDLDKLSFNTAISRMMEFTNEFTSQDVRPKSVLEAFVLLLSPFAPHLAEELWSLLGHPQTLAYEPWPEFDPALLVESEIEVPVQVNGKMRGKVTVPAGADQATVEAAAKAHDTIAGNLAGKTIVKVVYVPGKLLNIVVK